MKNISTAPIPLTLAARWTNIISSMHLEHSDKPCYIPDKIKRWNPLHSVAWWIAGSLYKIHQISHRYKANETKLRTYCVFHSYCLHHEESAELYFEELIVFCLCLLPLDHWKTCMGVNLSNDDRCIVNTICIGLEMVWYIRGQAIWTTNKIP